MAEVVATTVDLWVVHAPDAQVRSAVALIEYDPATDFRRDERGKWLVSLVQKRRTGDVQVTRPVQVSSSRDRKIMLGQPTARMTYSDPVYLRIVYSAPDGAAAFFWAGSTYVSVTLNLN